MSVLCRDTSHSNWENFLWWRKYPSAGSCRN